MFTVALRCFAIFVLVALCVGKECRPGPERQVWKHEKGTFKSVAGTKQWQEYNSDGTLGTLFRQIHQEGTAIVIRNDEREIELLLRDDLCGIKNKGESQFQQLYSGGWLKIVDCT